MTGHAGRAPRPLSGLVWPPCERTFRRVFTSADGTAVNDAVHCYLAAVPASGQQELPGATRHEREQRRAAAQARTPPVPGLLPQAATDGKAVRGATRPDGTRVHLLWAFHAGQGRTLAQREVGACASAATPARPGATGRRKRSPTPSPACRRAGRTPPPGHPRPPALEHREPRALRPRRRPEGQDRQHARHLAALRNLVIGAFRKVGHANIAHARRYYARDDQRIPALYGYA